MYRRPMNKSEEYHLRKVRYGTARELRAAGLTWVEIGRRLRREWPELNGRVAIKIAHGWSNAEVAEEWNARWPDDLMTAKSVGLFEARDPSLRRLRRFAELYSCAVGDLVAEMADHRDRDPYWPDPGSTGSGRATTVEGNVEPSGTDPVPGFDTRPRRVEDDDMERRDALKLAGGAAISTALGGSAADALFRVIGNTLPIDGVDERTIDVASLEAAMVQINRWWRRGNLSTMVEELPGVAARILAARSVVTDPADAERLAAVHASAVATAGCLFRKAGWSDLELAAGRRAFDIAERGADLTSRAVTGRTFVTALANNRLAVDAVDAVATLDRELHTATTSIATAASGTGGDPLPAMARGALLLRGAEAAAEAGDDHAANALVDEAGGVARQLDGRELWDGLHEFGPALVAAQRVRLELKLHNYGHALTAAATVAPHALSPERRVAFHLDVATAHVHRDDRTAALNHARLAERQAPQEIRINPLAQDLFRQLGLPRTEPLPISPDLVTLTST